ncbi:MAG TPA: hydantoinase/oxoprolinase family protein [Candidatus Binatia bacterium]|jgi:N-methylhydantoinase A|nr:hydantoinase/oxoprolinase family protein [Candidatus Binatia bacterium]
MVAEQLTPQNESRIGVDTGGTFTDFVWFAGNRLKVYKQLSTPQDPSLAVLQGLQTANSLPTAAMVHGSTVATNALLERRGARTALLITAGFRDVLAIGRQNRPELYALVPQKPPPLIPREWRFEVEERVSAQGDVVRALDLSRLEAVVDELRGSSIESVAICFLFSFLMPHHERAVRDYLLKRLPAGESGNLFVSLSSEILPEYREYERTSTTVINAYVTPIMTRYLRRLADAVQPRPVTVMQSNGGIISADVAAGQAARTVLSGPAGGVVGAHYVARQAGFVNAITFDMGGTSTDVALCPGVLPATANGQIAGMPLRLPILDIHTVGAGGGSMVSVDAGGALHVGPQSAGADPGPISYGLARGRKQDRRKGEVGENTEWYVTTTDANLVLGRLDAGHFLGGSIRLDEEAACGALSVLAEQINAPSAQAAAWDVVRVANATMERAIRRISVERGFDPRQFTLVAFGGAGPLHACDLAHSLQIPRVLVPPVPGVLSALGMLVAEPTRDYSQSVLRRLESDGDNSWLDDSLAPLRRRAVSDMASEGFQEWQLRFQSSLDLRYEGQSHELTVGYQNRGGHLTGEHFHVAHEMRYGYARRQATIEVVNVRLTAIVPRTPPELPHAEAASEEASALCIGTKPVWFDGGEQAAALYNRSMLHAGHQFGGPAIVFQYDSTTVIPPDWGVNVDLHGNMIVERRPL